MSLEAVALALLVVIGRPGPIRTQYGKEVEETG